jgi:hypothetical protein
VTPIAPSALRSLEYAAIRKEKSAISEVDLVEPRPLELHEIPDIVEQFRHSAQLAKEAGFDGIELHAANDYLPDHFLQDGSYHRTDEYSGPIEFARVSCSKLSMPSLPSGGRGVWRSASRRTARTAPGPIPIRTRHSVT